MACERCDGTGWRFVDHDGARRVERCACWRESVATRLLAEVGIEPRYARCTLDNLVIYDNEKFQTVVAKAARFVRDFPVVTKGLILTGPPGIGKTHIAAAVLRQLVIEKQVRGLFYSVPNLLKIIRSTYNPIVRTAEMDVLRPVMEAELLVLDDLGREKPSDWVEETLNLIVDTRYSHCRATIFTTNHQVLEDSTDPDSLQVRVGFRMWSRLYEMCEFLEYDGGDYRMMPANGGADDLATLWKQARKRRHLPARTHGPARAQLREPKELRWPGGKAGRN